MNEEDIDIYHSLWIKNVCVKLIYILQFCLRPDLTMTPNKDELVPIQCSVLYRLSEPLYLV